MVHVGRAGKKGALVTGREIRLQRCIGSLVFNAVLAPGPVNGPAFPFSSGAKGEPKMEQTRPVPGSGATKDSRLREPTPGWGSDRGARRSAVKERGVI